MTTVSRVLYHRLKRDFERRLSSCSQARCISPSSTSNLYRSRLFDKDLLHVFPSPPVISECRWTYLGDAVSVPKYSERTAESSSARHGTARLTASAHRDDNTMTKFSYSDYLSQFRNAGRKCSGFHPRPRTDFRRGVTSEQEDVDSVVSAISRGDVEAFHDLTASSSHCLMRENKDGWLPLHHAAFHGQAECLKCILRVHPGSIDKRTLQEQTALLLSVSCEHLPSVRYLLESGADPDICSNNKETPLYKACELQNVDMVSLLLSHGATVNQRCAQGWTALHEAVSRNNTEICGILIRAGATTNPPNTYSITPLIVAAQRGLMLPLSYLIEKGADVNMQTCDGSTALHEASKNGHREVVALLLTKNADANKPTNSGLLPLHVAAQHGHHEIVSLLVSVTSRAMLRHSGITPLHLAAERDRHAVAAVLLRAGADVNATLALALSDRYSDRRATALYFAVANGSSRTTEVLLKAGASPSLDPVSPLLAAARLGCVTTVSLLLERGADVDARIPSHLTTFPAIIALCSNNLALLKCVVKHGCDVLSCFTCTYGGASHPPSGVDANSPDWLMSSNCNEPPERATQFCEWISTPAVCEWAGPVVDLLLEHVGSVQLCSRLTELLDSREEWHSIKRKSSSPRSLLHLCRLMIRTQMARDKLRSISSLPLPNRLIRYLSVAD